MNVIVTATGDAEKETLSPVLDEQLTAAARVLLAQYGPENGEVAIILAEDSYLQELNRRFRGLDAPTDVLAFNMLEPAGSKEAEAAGESTAAVGDIYISLDRARDQAAQAGRPFEREVLILAIHGLLHLFGYDHDSAAAAETMEQKEADILGEIVNSSWRRER